MQLRNAKRTTLLQTRVYTAPDRLMADLHLSFTSHRISQSRACPKVMTKLLSRTVAKRCFCEESCELCREN